MKKQISESLRALGLEASDFRNLGDLEDQFKFLRRHYHKQCLKTHPDKGGDADVFRNVFESFTFIKDLVDKNLITTLKFNDDPLEFDFHSSSKQEEMPSYQYYQEAAKQDMPPYRVEYAKSGRSSCNPSAKKPRLCYGAIAKDEVRIGSLNGQSGTYGRWSHVYCWSVPSRIWLGLPDPDVESDPQVFIQALLKLDGVSLIGFADLKKQDQLTFVKHVSDKACWAKKREVQSKTTETEASNSSPVPQGGDVKPSAIIDATTAALGGTEPNNQVVQKKNRFQIPVPGVDGALPNSLQGQTIVTTGTFPEVCGGVGLNMGKDKAKAMCQSFGARVTASVSGKTTLLLVGKSPGMSKVQKAQARKIPTADIHNIRNMIMGQIATLEELPPATITNFSAGYQLAGGFNGLAVREKSEASYCSEGFRQPSSAAGVPKNTKRPITIEAAPPIGAKPSGTQENPPVPADGKENSNPSNLNKNPADIDTKDLQGASCHSQGS